MARPRRLKKPGAAQEKAIESAEAVALHEALRRRLTQIRYSDISFLATVGERNDGTEVLVPLVDWQLFGVQVATASDDESADRGEELYSGMISVDNLAFLLHDMSYDLREVIRLVSNQSRGGINPLEERMRYSVRMLKQASTHLLSAVDQIESDLLELEDSRQA